MALFGTAMVAVAVVGFALLVNLLATAGSPGQQDRDLRDRADAVARWVATADLNQLSGHQDLAPIDLGTSSETFAELLDPSGAVLFSTGQLHGVIPAPPPALLAGGGRTGGAYATGGLLRFYARPWSRPDLSRSGFVVAGQATRVPLNALRGTRGFLTISALFSIAGGLIASWWIAGRALRPLRAVAATAGDIGRTRDFSRRLPATPDQGEVGALTSAFNAMLAALEEAYQRLAMALSSQRRFVADASHELRSPLTTIRTNAGLLQRPALDSADREDAVADIVAEAERMSRLVNDLLTLARADAGVALDREPQDLGALAADAARQFRSLHPDRVIGLNLVPTTVVGDRDALRQLILILLDNAAKHTRAGGQVELALTATDGDVVLTVIDDGSGIPPPDLERIFERFYQADPSRYRGGAGLGLSIARWIAGEHGGTITAANREGGGAVFTVRLPAEVLVNS